MPLRLKIDPGGEWLLPFAKKKLRDLKAEMKRLGVNFRTKWFQITDAERIFLQSQWVAGDVWLDVIRISAGGGFDFYYANPSVTFDAEDAQSQIEQIDAILASPETLAALALLTGTTVEALTASLLQQKSELQSQLESGSTSVPGRISMYALNVDAPKTYPINHVANIATDLTRFVRGGGDPQKQVLKAMSAGVDGNGDPAYTILDRAGQQRFTAEIAAGYTFMRDPQLSGNRIGVTMLNTDILGDERTLLTDGAQVRFLGEVSTSNIKLVATDDDFFAVYAVSVDRVGSLSKVVSLARGELLATDADEIITEIAANQHDICFLRWLAFGTLDVYIDDQVVHSVANDSGAFKVKAFKDGFVVAHANVPFDLFGLVSLPNPILLKFVTFSRSPETGLYTESSFEHSIEINGSGGELRGATLEVDSHGVGYLYWQIYDEGAGPDEVTHSRIYKSDGTVVTVKEAADASDYYRPIVFSASLKDTCAFLVQGEQAPHSFYQFPELKIIKGDGAEVTFASDTYFSPAFVGTTSDAAGVGNSNDFYSNVLVGQNTTQQMFGSRDVAYFPVTDPAGKFLLGSDGSKLRTDDSEFAPGTPAQVAYVTRNDKIYALGVGSDLSESGGYHVATDGSTRKSYKPQSKFWAPIPCNLARLKDFEYWASLEEDQ